MSDDQQSAPKTVLVESTTVTKRQEGESASLSFAGSKHLTKWLIAAVGGLFLNLGHSVLEDFLPAKGEQQRQEAKVTAEGAVFRNDTDNKSIKEKLDQIQHLMKQQSESYLSSRQELLKKLVAEESTGLMELLKKKPKESEGRI